MREAPDRPLRLSETARVEAFSDGVFAIIITLLVLDVRTPKVEPGQLLYGLLQQWPTYFAFVTSFLYIGVVWQNHHAAFNRIRLIDRGLHWANLGLLFTTALLPFPTVVLSDAMQKGHPADARTAIGLYALIGALLCVSWLTFFHYLSRHPELRESHIEEGFFARECMRAGAGIVLYVAAGILGYLVAPPLAFVIFLALPIFYGITSDGIYELPVAVRRARSRRRSTNY